MNLARFNQIHSLLDRAISMATHGHEVDAVVDALDEIETTLLNLRGSFKIMKGDFKGALMDFEIAHSLDPLSDNWSERGLVKTILGDHEGALVDLEKSLEENSPTAAFAMLTRGHVNSMELRETFVRQFRPDVPRPRKKLHVIHVATPRRVLMLARIPGTLDGYSCPSKSARGAIGFTITSVSV